MTGERWCFIDGCRTPATLVRHAYPDDILLCRDHLWIYEQDTDDIGSEPCGRPGPCDVCDDAVRATG